MKNDVIISKMINYVEKILKYTDGMKYSEFESKDMVVEACVFNLSQLGELANKVDKDFQKIHNTIPFFNVKLLTSLLFFNASTALSPHSTLSSTCQTAPSANVIFILPPSVKLAPRR